MHAMSPAARALSLNVLRSSLFSPAALCALLSFASFGLSVPALAEGGHSFNPDISLTLSGKFVGGDVPSDAGPAGFWPAAHEHGAAAAQEKTAGFMLGESELMLGANVDHLFRAQANFAIGEAGTEVEEAWFQTLGLGHGLTLRAGRFLSGIGYLNEQHPHAWDFADSPLMYRALFGEHGFIQDGVQARWLAPTETFLEFGLEAGRGANFPGSEQNSKGGGATAAFVRIGGDVGAASAWRLGLSHLYARIKDRDGDGFLLDTAGNETVEPKLSGDSRTSVLDFVWKWSPGKGRGFKVQAELFQREEKGALGCSDATVGNPCNGDPQGDYGSRQHGGYAQAVWQFAPAWRVGVRYDQLDAGQAEIANVPLLAASAHVSRRNSVMLDWSPSEFSRLRLQAADDRSLPDAPQRTVTVQYVMSLGAHGAHAF